MPVKKKKYRVDYDRIEKGPTGKGYDNKRLENTLQNLEQAKADKNEFQVKIQTAILKKLRGEK